MSGTAEPATIQCPARRRRWFLTPSARKGTRINSACAYGARRECNQVLATKDPARECVRGVGLASPLGVRADEFRTHPQKRAEDHRRIGARPNGITDQTSVLLCVLLWMHCRFGRESKTKITSTTDFTDHTDEKRPASNIRAIRVIRGSSRRGSIFVVEIFVVQNVVVSDANCRRRTQVGRSSDAKYRETSSPQAVFSIRVRAQYENRRTVRTQNPGTPGSG